MNGAAPLWLDAVTAVFLMLGALGALIGSVGVLRLETFFQRIHAPTLGATAGTWGIAVATMAQASFATGQLYLHALLIAVFLALTTPVTTVFLMRAALFRRHLRGQPDHRPSPPARPENQL